MGTTGFGLGSEATTISTENFLHNRSQKPTLRQTHQIRIPMKESDFQYPLQGNPRRGGYMRDDKMVVTRADRIQPDSAPAIPHPADSRVRRRLRSN
jgi:hypothetical protein